MIKRFSKASIEFDDIGFLEKILPIANLIMLFPICWLSNLPWYQSLAVVLIFTATNILLSKIVSKSVGSSGRNNLLETIKSAFCLLYLFAVYLILEDPAPYWMLAILPTIRAYCVYHGKLALYLSLGYIASIGFGIYTGLGSATAAMVPVSTLVIYLILFHSLLFHFKTEVLSRKKGEQALSLANKELKKQLEDRIYLESQSVTAQKLESVGQLAAGVAHEINTPIQYVSDNIHFIRTSISGFQELLNGVRAFSTGNESEPIEKWKNKLGEASKKLDLDYLMEEIPKALKESEEGMNRIANIVKALKEFSHPGEAAIIPQDLNLAVENTLTVCRNEWAKVADLESNLDPNLPLVPCVLDQIKQVLLNLVINAAQALFEKKSTDPKFKGKIQLSTFRDDGCAVVTIKDNGNGIPLPIRQKIFDPFFTTKRVGVGTGQGLYISRNIIVKKHKGTIVFSSELGAGTEFQVRLPLNLEEITA